MTTTTATRPVTVTVTHPDWCANANTGIDCGDHLTPTVTIDATADQPGTVDTAMVLTEAGVPGVYLTATDARGRTVAVMCTVAQGWSLVGALAVNTRRAEAYHAAHGKVAA